MKTEYAIMRGTIEQVMNGDGEVVFKNEYPEYILNELIMLDDDDNYTVEEYRVDDDGEFYDGSDYDTAQNFRERFGTWYAVLANEDDDDLGYGSYSRAKAFEMLRNYPEGMIAVVEMGTDPTVVEILRAENE